MLVDREGAGMAGPGWVTPAMVRRVLAALVLAAGIQALPNVARAAEPQVQAKVASGAAIVVDARAVLKAPEALIWQTLTDYERLPDFIPGMKRSRVIDRIGPTAIVEQDGEASFLFFRLPIHVVVESAEFPPYSITIRVLRGTLKQLDGHYRIERGASGEERVLTWSGIIEPDTFLPAFFTLPLMRANIERQFAGMVQEIERRDAERLLRGARSAAD